MTMPEGFSYSLHSYYEVELDAEQLYPYTRSDR